LHEKLEQLEVVIPTENVLEQAYLFCKLSYDLGVDPFDFADFLLKNFNEAMDAIFEADNFEKSAQKSISALYNPVTIFKWLGGQAGTAFRSVSDLANAYVLKPFFYTLTIGAPIMAAATIALMATKTQESDPKFVDKYTSLTSDIAEYRRLIDEIKDIRDKSKKKENDSSHQ